MSAAYVDLLTGRRALEATEANQRSTALAKILPCLIPPRIRKRASYGCDNECGQQWSLRSTRIRTAEDAFGGCQADGDRMKNVSIIGKDFQAVERRVGRHRR